jgi:predicted N-acetyltransferase YhbS
MNIIDQAPQHAAEIERLLDLVFGPGRTGKTVYRLRDGLPPAPGFSFVIERDGALAATLRFWPVALPARGRALLLGPIAVQPALAGQGLGRALMRHGIEKARAEGWPAILLVGDEPYYGPLGFSRAPAQNLQLPGPVDVKRFLARELVPGALDGVVGMVGRAF